MGYKIHYKVRMCPIVLRFLAVTLTLQTTSMCAHACGDESVDCLKAAQLFQHPFQRLFFTCASTIYYLVQIQKTHAVELVRLV